MSLTLTLPFPVPLFSRRPKTRAEVVAEADRARSRGRIKKAIAGYRKALQSDPTDAAVNVKLAPLLARAGDAAAAKACFRAASTRYLDQGFMDRAAAVNSTATTLFPLEASFRLELARLNVLRRRNLDAISTLLDGGKALAKVRRLEGATSLLARALEIEPWHLETVLALAPMLARSGRDDEARHLIAGVEVRHRGEARRRIRWIAFRLWPSPRTFWRWIRAGR